MTELFLDEHQTRILAAAEGPIVIRDASGKAVAVISAPDEDDLPKLTATDLIDLSRRTIKPNPRWHTTDDVLRFLEAQDAT